MTAINDKLFDYFYAATGLSDEKRFREATEDLAKARKPYASYQIIDNAPIGQPHYLTPNEYGIQPINQNKELIVQISFVGAEAAELIEAFIMRLHMESSLIRGELLNFGLLDIGRPVDTSVKLSETNERRYSVRVTLSHMSEVLDEVGLIEHVDIEGSFSH